MAVVTTLKGSLYALPADVFTTSTAQEGGEESAAPAHSAQDQTEPGEARCLASADICRWPRQQHPRCTWLAALTAPHLMQHEWLKCTRSSGPSDVHHLQR